jgi:prepilin-type N-terminal cleavage/methylation domain-containing protein
MGFAYLTLEKGMAMEKTTRTQSGVTLVEVMIALLLLGLTIGGTLTSFVTGRISAFHARYHIQAMNVLQAKAEELAWGAYESVTDQDSTSVVLDPGPDLQSGTADDVLGELRVQVDDRMDLDEDGDTGEEEIDVDGDGINDRCKPVHLTLSWRYKSFGGFVSVTGPLHTIIAKR